jgi:rhodanese-related sulfurtransferase
MRRAALALLALASLTGCAESISRGELLAQVRAGAAPTIVDVRSRAEFEESHVPGAVHVPFHAILGGVESLPQPAEAGAPIVLYCEHGPRAGIARAQLWFVSDRPVRFLEGHMTAWKSEGLPVEPVSRAEAGAVTEAQRVLKPFKQRLMAALKAGLAEGPEPAIDACRLEAPRIADSLASDILRVGRTSHRLRNPANAPEPWMEPLLAELRAAEPGAIPHRVASIGDGRIGYVEPIYVQPPCLTCHGSDLGPSIRSRLREAYPSDQATGFAVGDFRGLFWVELSETKAP